MKLGLRAAFAAALVMSSIVGLAVVASAHALYDSSVPAANSTVNAAPSTVKALFVESVNPKGSSFTVAGPGGVADLGDGHVDQNDPNRKTMLVSLKPNLPSGKYTVSWTTVSGDDGAVASGTFVFTVAAPASASAPKAAATTPVALPRAGGVPWTVLVGAGAVLALAGFAARRISSGDYAERKTG